MSVHAALNDVVYRVLPVWHYNVSNWAPRGPRCTDMHKRVQVTVAEKYVGTVRAEFCADRSKGVECAGRNSVTHSVNYVARSVFLWKIRQFWIADTRTGTDGRGLHLIHNVFLKVFCALCKGRLSTAVKGAWALRLGRDLNGVTCAVRPGRRLVLLAQWLHFAQCALWTWLHVFGMLQPKPGAHRYWQPSFGTDMKSEIR